MLIAATAWDGVAAELEAMASAYSSITSGLANEWRGPSFVAVVAAAERYAKWLAASACQASETATQARAAAAAYEAAFEAAVPPPVIAANRALLTSLVATNILGQNTAAIAATELDYAEMWGQDASTMYGYASSASAASTLAPFRAPPQTTNSSGTVAQAAAVSHTAQTNAQGLPALLAVIPQYLHSVATPLISAQTASSPSLSDVLLNVTIGSLSPLNFVSIPGSAELFGLLMYSLAQTGVNFAKVYGVFMEFMQAPEMGELASGGTLVNSAAPVEVSASVGRAALVSNISVPHGWVSTAPEIRPAGVVLPMSSPAAVVATVTDAEKGSLFGGMALSGLAGRAIARAGGQATQPGTMTGGPAETTDSATINIILITEDE